MFGLRDARHLEQLIGILLGETMEDTYADRIYLGVFPAETNADTETETPRAIDDELVKANTAEIVQLRAEINERLAVIAQLADEADLYVRLDNHNGLSVTRYPKDPNDPEGDDEYLRRGQWASSSDRC